MSPKTKTLICLMALALPALDLPAQDRTPKSPAEPTKMDFTVLDRNQDASLTRDEAMAAADLESVFDTLDADRDGKISTSEFTRWNRAGRSTPLPADPSTAPTGSAGAQHMPRN